MSVGEEASCNHNHRSVAIVESLEQKGIASVQFGVIAAVRGADRDVKRCAPSEWRGRRVGCVDCKCGRSSRTCGHSCDRPGGGAQRQPRRQRPRGNREIIRRSSAAYCQSLAIGGSDSAVEQRRRADRQSSTSTAGARKSGSDGFGCAHCHRTSQSTRRRTVRETSKRKVRARRRCQRDRAIAREVGRASCRAGRDPGRRTADASGPCCHLNGQSNGRRPAHRNAGGRSRD